MGWIDHIQCCFYEVDHGHYLEIMKTFVYVGSNIEGYLKVFTYVIHSYVYRIQDHMDHYNPNQRNNQGDSPKVQIIKGKKPKNQKTT